MGDYTRRARRLVRIAGAGALTGALLPAAAFLDVAHAATKTWDGGGPNGLWSTGLNWTDDVAPVAGDALVFPLTDPVVSNKSTTNDFADGTVFASLTMGDSGYGLSGNAIQTTTITTTHASGQVSVGLGLIVPPGGTLTETVGAGGDVFQSSPVALGNGTLAYVANGHLRVPHNFTNVLANGQVTANGSGVLELTSGGGGTNVPWTVQSGTTIFNANNAFPALVTQTGGTVNAHQAQLAGYIGSGGTLSPGNAIFDATQFSVMGNVNIGAATTYELDINDVNNSDRLFVTGSVTLGGTLVVDATGFVPTGGQSFTIINNDTAADPVSGTFAGLAQGASVNVNGTNMTISYIGGDGNDVTLSTPPAFVWDGDAANDNWTTATNWVGDVAPSGLATETLEFPNATDKNVVNDFPAGTTFGNIVFSFADYVITGTAFNLDGSIVSINGANTNTISAPVTLTGGGQISIPNAGVQVAITSTLDAGGGPIVLSGFGFLNFTGTLTGAGSLVSAGPGGGAFLGGTLSGFAGPTTIDGGYLQVDGALTQSVVTLNGGFLSGGGSVGGIVATGGSVTPSDASPPNAVLGSAGNVTIGAGSKYSVDVDAVTAGVGHDQLNVTGTVTLGGTLEAGSMNGGPPVGQTLVIINNDGADPVVGTFAALPEGAVVTVNNIPLIVSYVGGDGNDVTLSQTASVWDGGGVGANWTTAANWVGDIAPVPNATLSLVFPDTALQKANTNNFLAGSAFKDILLTGSGYSMAGNAIALNGNLIGSNTSGTNTIATPFQLGGSRTFTQASGGDLVINSNVAIGDGNTLSLAGDGTHTLTGSLTDGALTKTGAGLATLPAMPLIDGPITVSGGTVRATGNTPAAIVVNGGSLVGAAQTGPITATSGGVAPGFITKGIITTTAFTASGTAFTGFEVDGIAPGVSHDQLVVNGTVNAGGFFSASSSGVPPIGQEVVVIDNDGVDPVVGTFTSLPEGGIFQMGGTYDTEITYTGGDGNDVAITVIPTFTWDGGGPNNDWTTALNWATDVAPSGNNGETLVFPVFTNQQANENTFPIGTSFKEIRFTGSGYDLTGNSLNLTEGITATNGTGTNVYNVPTDVGTDPTFSQTVGGTLDIQAPIDLNGWVLHLTGAGDHTGLDSVIDGDIDVSSVASGKVTLAGTLPGLTGSVFLNSGRLVLNGDLAQAGVAVAGGRLTGDGGTAVGLSATGGVVAPGALTSTAILGTTGALDLAAGSEFEVDVSSPTPGTGHDQITTTGDVTLGGTLSIDVNGSVAPGDQLVIVSNGGANPVVGTFAGLADGAGLVADGVPFTIDYQGGDGNDVVLTAGPYVSLSTAATVIVEGGTGASTAAGLSVELDQAIAGDVVVHVAITGGSGSAGTDTSALDMDLTIPGGSTSVAVPLNVLGDDVVEPDETVEVTLSVVSGAALAAPTVATVTVPNDDTATITVVNANVVITEGGPGSQGLALAAVSQLELALDNPSSTDIGVHLATQDGSAVAPDDYAAFDQVFTIPAGSTSFIVPLTIVDDNVDEPDESFTIRFLGATGATLNASDVTVTLIDNDLPVVIPTTTTPGGPGVTPPSTAPGTPTTVDPGTLPTTGGSPNRILWLAGALLALGVVLIVARRRTA